MRLHLLPLLFISGLSHNVGYAGTLVGDWYQEETKAAQKVERRAYSQPISQSTETNQVTLGIKGSGLMFPIEFYAVISGKSTNTNCSSTVSEIIIDTETFPVRSNAHASDITSILTKTDDEHERLWRKFKQGNNLFLRILQTCNAKDVQSNEVSTFNFSLSGSSSAYRFVAGQGAIENRNQKSKGAAGSGAVTRFEDIETKSEDGFSNTILFSLAIALFGIALIVKLVTWHTKPKLSDSSIGADTERLATRIDDYIERRDSPGTGGPHGSENTATIESFPRFKVDYVVDGDTVIVSAFSKKLTIRLDSIDCPEDGQEWGDIATAGLIKLIGGEHVHVEEHTIDFYGRTVATLYVNNVNDAKWLNVNERMVTLGHAWVMRKYYNHLPKRRQAQLNRLERWAKSKRVGLWRIPNPTPPWKWRQVN